VVKIARMHRAARRLHEELGREPTDEELAEDLKVTPWRVAQMRMAATRPASLDAPIAGDESNNFADVVEDDSAETPYERLEEKAVNGMLKQLVTNLNPREASILSARFGLDGNSPKTLDDVGVKFGVTRERVRQIQKVALNKLRKMLEKLEPPAPVDVDILWGPDR
jgi:RNA polymerase primary sigma factor